MINIGNITSGNNTIINNNIIDSSLVKSDSFTEEQKIQMEQYIKQINSILEEKEGDKKGLLPILTSIKNMSTSVYTEILSKLALIGLNLE